MNTENVIFIIVAYLVSVVVSFGLLVWMASKINSKYSNNNQKPYLDLSDIGWAGVLSILPVLNLISCISLACMEGRNVVIWRAK